MRLQGNNLGFSAPVAFRSKAQRTGNGLSPCQALQSFRILLTPLTYVRVGHAAAGRHRSAQRVDLSAPMALLRLLRRTQAIRDETRLALNADKPTASQIITLKKYYKHGNR